jgi:carbon-monoxide dehydrogenase medium subunit
MFIRRLPGFEYHTPSSVKEAIAIAAKHNKDARFIAGGTDLLLAMKKREVMPGHLVSLGGIGELRHITVLANDKPSGNVGGLKIGALTTLAQLLSSDVVRKHYVPLWDAVDVMASPQIRSLATIGGNLCSAVPSADTAPPLLALDASVEVVSHSGKKRIIPLNEFFIGPKQTALAPKEILTHILIPKMGASSGGCYLKLMRRSAMDLALVGVAVYLKLDKGKNLCKEARIALGAVAPLPIRVPAAEAMLVGKKIDEAQIQAAAQASSMQCSPISDIRATLEYRCSMVEVLTKRAIETALQRITG